MALPGSFRSDLERLVFELSVAHDREVELLQAEVSRLHDLIPELPTKLVPRERDQQLLVTPPMTPTTPSQRHVTPAMPELRTTPRQLSFVRNELPAAHSEFPPWDLGDFDQDAICTISKESVASADSPTFLGLGPLNSKDPAKPVEVDEVPKGQYPKDLLSQLPDDYIEHLQTQFDRFDTEGKDRISLDACLTMLRASLNAPLDRQDLITALKQIAAERVAEDEFTSEEQIERRAQSVMQTEAKNENSEFIEYWITFEDFVYLMASGRFDVAEVMQTPSRAFSFHVRGGLRNALLAYDARQMSLAALNAQQRRKHQRIVFFLDWAPAPVIILNAFVMGLRQDNDSEALVWKVLDLLFLTFYIFEAAMKLWVFRPCVYCCGPEWRWNWFDMLCISISLCDMFLEYLLPLIKTGGDVPFVGELMMLKMLRLARLARLVKTLHYPFFHELKAMVFGVVAGGRVILWAIVMLFVCIYFIGCMMNYLVGDKHQEFDTVPASAFTVFRCFTDGCAAYDGTPLHERLRADYGALFILGYVLAFMFITVGVFNLIMATFIESVVSTTATRKQEELCMQTEAARRGLEGTVIRLIIESRTNDKGLISDRLQRDVERCLAHDVHAAFLMLPLGLQVTKFIFRKWMDDREFHNVLQMADIDTSNTTYLWDVLDSDMSGELSLKELIDGLMRLRGPITKCDMIGVRMQVRYTMHMIQQMQPMIKDMHHNVGNAGPETKRSRRSKRRMETIGLSLTQDVTTTAGTESCSSSMAW